MAVNDGMQKKIMIAIAAVIVVLGGVYFMGTANKEPQQTTQKTAVSGHEEFVKGRALSKEGKMKEALEMYIKAADKGNLNGMNYAGMYLCNGYGGIQKDVPKGIGYLTKAADAGLTYAQVNLGRAYMNPQYGLKADREKGLNYMTMAAEKNNSAAMLYLGYYYETGMGVTKDKEKALEWYAKSEKLGNKAAKKRADNLKDQ